MAYDGKEGTERKTGALGGQQRTAGEDGVGNTNREESSVWEQPSGLR